jgi:hypothetical protein
MNTKWLTITSIVVFIYLIIVNVFIFPAVFPGGLAEKFTNTRTESLPLFHALAFAATAAILTILLVALCGHSCGCDNLCKLEDHT